MIGWKCPWCSFQSLQSSEVAEHISECSFCRCGSGHLRRPLRDAAGIFCSYVCDKCEDQAVVAFDPQIFEPGTAYARSGDEAHLG